MDDPAPRRIRTRPHCGSAARAAFDFEREQKMSEITCTTCGKTATSKETPNGETRLPRGWKRIDSAVRCTDCVRAAYVLRAVELPVAKPMDSTWAEFRELIRGQWQETSRCATWMMRELYARDTMRDQQPKQPPMPRIYLYPEARERFPAIAPTSVSALEHLVQAKYRAARRKLVWTLEQQLPTLRYPQPLLIPAASWKIELSDDARKDMLLSVRMQGQWHQLRLRGGGQFRRQRKDVEAIIAGDAIKGELAILRKAAYGTDRAGRNGQQSSAHGVERGDFGQRVQYDVIAKIVGRFPRSEAPPRRGQLRVRSDSDSMLLALNIKDERLWVVNADHVRRWAIEHARRLQRWGDDSKAELRPDVPFGQRRHNAAIKYRDRIHTFCQQTAASLVGYAVRRKFATVVYDDSDRSYLDRFDWSGLKSAIRTKCEAEGLEFVEKTASGAEEKKSPTSLASEV